MKLMLALQGNLDDEPGSAARRAVDLNRSVMLIDGPLDETQTEAGAIGAVCPRWVGAIEAFEDVRDGFRCDSDSVIGDFEDCAVSITRHAHRYVSAGAREFDGIVGEIQNDAFDPTRIAAQCDIRLAIPRKVDFL